MKVLASQDSPLQKIVKLNELYIDFFASNRKFVRMFHFLQMPQFHKQVSDEMQKYCGTETRRLWDIVIGIMKQGIETGILRFDLNPIEIGIIFWSSSTALMLRGDTEGDRWKKRFNIDLSHTLEVSNQLFLNAILTDKGQKSLLLYSRINQNKGMIYNEELMIIRLSKTIPLILVLVLPLLAQQKQTLTIDQAIQIGMENSKALRTSQFKVDAADAKASETNTLGLPSLKFNGTYTRLSDVPAEAIALPANSFGPGFPPSDVSMVLSPTILNNYGLKATLQQPLFTGGKISGAIDAAGYTSEATKEDLKKIERMFFTISRRHIGIYIVQSNSKISLMKMSIK